MHCFMRNVISHPYLKFSGGLAKLIVKLWYEWAIALHTLMTIFSVINTLIPALVQSIFISNNGPHDTLVALH